MSSSARTPTTRSRLSRLRLLVLVCVVALAIIVPLVVRFGPRVLLYAAWCALLIFVGYAATHLPRRYRSYGLGQVTEAVDNKFGKFGGWYPSQPLVPESRLRAGRNDPCPCGSGLKYKHCCLERDALGG